MNSLFTLSTLKVVLVGNDFSNMVVKFAFVVAFWDWVVGNVKHPYLTIIHRLKSHIYKIFVYNRFKWVAVHTDLELPEHIGKLLKEVSKEIFNHLEDVNLFTLKIPMLDHFAKDLYKFENLSIFNGQLYEYLTCIF